MPETVKEKINKLAKELETVSNMNRKDRRRIAKLNGIKKIPSIINIKK